MSPVSKLPHRLLLATRNAHKTREVREILGAGWIVADLTAHPEIADVEETGATFEENARLKAVAAARHFDGWVMADDSGLEVDALGGAPGVRSARFAGDGATMAGNRALLRERLAGVPAGDRAARFRCALALARDGEVVAVFDGVVEGTVIDVERGGGGFGYDPLFVPEGHDRTFAELPAAVKHTLSHRGRAMARLAEFLRREDRRPA